MGLEGQRHGKISRASRHFADFGGENAGSFQLRYAGGRKSFYYDDNAGRRAVGGTMFGRKKTTDGAVKEDGPCWDHKAQAFFAEQDRFDVYITSVTRRTGFGKSTTHNLDGTRGYEISGLLTYPKQWWAELNFDDSDGEFGTWFYHTSGPKGGQRQPFLEIWVSDRDFAIREAIASAHQAALVSGHKRSLLRFWKRKGDGIFTPEEAKVGWSCDSRYPLTGMFVWEQFESVRLPNWALPFSHERFSTEGMPEWFDL